MKYSLIAICFLLNSALWSQSSGTIVYDRTIFYSKILEQLPYLSEEEKERQKLTWGKDEGRSSLYNLSYTPEMSVYTYGKQERERSFSWKQEEFLLIQHINENTIKHQRVLGGKLLVIEDEFAKRKWKIENEIREVAGYICMKAVTQDTIKSQTIAAWFTTEIPVSTGPEGYGGLPGMILMLDINDGTAIIEATSIDLEAAPYEMPKKIKGKKVKMEEYTASLSKYFDQCIEGERNPFWRLRY